MKTFYVASYGKGDDKGIYIVSFNEETLELKKIQQILTQDFPSYLIAKNKELYVSYKNARSNNEGGGGSLTVVSNFSLTKSLKTLIISMLLSFFIVNSVKIIVLIRANVCYNGHRR